MAVSGGKWCCLSLGELLTFLLSDCPRKTVDQECPSRGHRHLTFLHERTCKAS